jgi:hypothetical protein
MSLNAPKVVEHANGNKFWWLNNQLHRTDGPAIEWANGNMSWYVDGKCHRIDGPALVRANDNSKWYLYNKLYELDDWLIKNDALSEEDKVIMKLTYG